MPNNTGVAPLPDSLINGSVFIVLMEQLITALGLTIQLCNTMYALRHAFTMKTSFNTMLAISMVIYSASFLPLFLTAGLTSTSGSLTGSSESDIASREYFISVLNMSHNFLFASASFMYILLVQLRFRVIKNIMPYSNIWDTVFVVFTVAIWTVAAFLIGTLGTIIWPARISVVLQLQSFVLWSIYALFVDTVLSFTFAVKLFSMRRKITNLMKSSDLCGDAYARRLMRNVMRALALLCGIAWVSFVLVAVSATVFSRDPVQRKLLYRLGYALSSLEFTGALIFIYSVKSIFKDRGSASNTGSSVGPISPLPSPQAGEMADREKQLYSQPTTLGFASTNSSINTPTPLQPSSVKQLQLHMPTRHFPVRKTSTSISAEDQRSIAQLRNQSMETLMALPRICCCPHESKDPIHRPPTPHNNPSPRSPLRTPMSATSRSSSSALLPSQPWPISPHSSSCNCYCHCSFQAQQFFSPSTYQDGNVAAASLF
ncbi:hypothetical protein BASA50_004744 [Batrachochytrium salamandrivorans]|uniref:SSD domain-containing protein n=1 Tax=Batrachochytrium salamandrivorans TaxID=1357716 RepID=A0ABQ8FEM2_9FUNG|nr:hypothetical protein BASA62_009449 [Batrachochytrium salamandrivorans]KAH6563474.1 hypothetical protein BASA60_010684 [Batrachochytrium salamandrivorans]KAH6596986.1 hypothetical protein BASA50_004744 [Batrachochytrium salamandrivorans]KAH9273471.1 hypothetical protein BASA83_004137 [Batrachochytrium salamandrivorans]